MGAVVHSAEAGFQRAKALFAGDAEASPLQPPRRWVGASVRGLDVAKRNDAVLTEDAPMDRYWGAGKDGGGLNKLGKLLMQVRGELT